MTASLTLDHLVVAAATLADGIAHVRAQLGVDIPAGGAHPAMGTHNHLVAVGRRGTPQSCFLEVIAPDPTAPAPARRRWFGLDSPPPRPRLVTWVARTSDLDTALRELPHAAGPAIDASRGDLRWRIGVADDGSMPCDGAFPTLIEWPPAVGGGRLVPSESMADVGLRLVRLEIAHPRAGEIAAALAGHLDDACLAFAGSETVALSAIFDTPLGRRRLG